MKFLFLIFLVLPFYAKADPNFPPESQKSLEEGKAWVETSFKPRDTMATTIFRAWYPFPPDKVWKVQIDSNLWKEVHSDYTDSRALDRNQFEMVASRKPTQIKAFYELVGEEIFPSEHGRIPGQNWTSYALQRFNLPWPLTDRWVVIKIKNDENNSRQGRYRYDYKMAAGNFKELKGYWELLPVAGKPGWTEFRGEYKSDPGIQIPQFLAKTIFRASMRRCVEDNIKILKNQN